ncbi:MAG: acyl carrier protein [Collinsella bouchesdurhonensis]|nr:acyl carrier protein [Collinsella bouchesdurhonensis]
MLFDDVRDVIVETVGCEAAAVSPEARLNEDLGADSLAAMELIMALEEKLDIEIDDAELDQFKTVNDLVSYLETKVQ